MLNKIVAGCLAVSVCIIVGFVAFNFTDFFAVDNYVNKVEVLLLTPATVSRIDAAVLHDPLISGIHVQSINFQKNIRIDTYTNIGNPHFGEIYKQYINNKTVDAPLFTQHKDLNTRIIKLINGEFLCIPFAHSAAVITMPGAAKYVNHICSIGVPPYRFNNFAGIFTVYLSRTPTRAEYDTLFLFSRSISIDIANSNASLNK